MAYYINASQQGGAVANYIFNFAQDFNAFLVDNFHLAYKYFDTFEVIPAAMINNEMAFFSATQKYIAFP